ncbi:MAG: cytochrome c biogenesis protein CcdA [Pseudomonadota bacterium]
MTDITLYLMIAGAGFLSFLSPCVLPLVPPYLCYLGGTSMDRLANDAEAIPSDVSARVLLSSLFFILGFTTVFVALGAGASLAGQFIAEHKILLGQIAGAVIVLFGLHFLGVFKIGLFYREARYQTGETNAATSLGAYIIGLAFAFGWTPCIGPVLGVVLALAANEASLNAGIGMLFVYSLGLGIPFLLAAMAIRPFLKFMGKFRRHLGKVEKVMGVLLVVTGVLFMTGSINDFGQWMLETFPVLNEIEGAVVTDDFQERLIESTREAE